MRSVLGAVTGSVFKVRQLISLPVQYVLDRLSDTSLIPQISFAAFFSPRRRVMQPTSILAQLSSRVGLERGQARSGFSEPRQTITWTWFVLTFSACKCHLRSSQVWRMACSNDLRCSASRITGLPSSVTGLPSSA